MKREKILAAVVRGWSGINLEKDADVDLASAITDEIVRLLGDVIMKSPMTRDCYLDELKKMYLMAVENRNVEMTLDILERLRINS